MEQPHEQIAERFRRIMPSVEFCSLRIVHERSESLAVRQDVLQPVSNGDDLGVMVTVVHQGGCGYAGTSDLTEAGLARALEHARGWAQRSAACGVIDFSQVTFAQPQGEYETPVAVAWDAVSLADKIALLQQESARLQRGLGGRSPHKKTDERIVDWEASLWHTESDTLSITNRDAHTRQRCSYIVPMLSVTANAGTETHTRTFGGRGYCRQGGLEVLAQTGFHAAAPQLSSEAVQLLSAPDCPAGQMDVLLAPDQMMLQIHESIGHPLELDRILGDERNYAGTSFVTPDMFGTYQYGSDLLNITFDPSQPEQYASYQFDDDGQPARKEYLIKNGRLLRGLGGVVSQARLGLPGVANARATTWNRPTIDRMANLNLEPGQSDFSSMVSAIERGVYMKTNCSWSIDDSRNKFQFGCEWGQLIEDGKLTTVVKKPNYRGVSATFWRNLDRVGNLDSYEVLGTPFCGKGEPNQVIRVGHAAPACVFSDVEVFGGEKA
ncbi:MAG: TldD/PmbA family protein [Desulfurellaceae bacterium]|nr:TldD/PmbA family protein [Desulfurellaceae bacterium]